MASASLSAALWHPVAPIAAMRHMNPADFIPFHLGSLLNWSQSPAPASRTASSARKSPTRPARVPIMKTFERSRYTRFASLCATSRLRRTTKPKPSDAFIYSAADSPHRLNCSFLNCSMTWCMRLASRAA